MIMKEEVSQKAGPSGDSYPSAAAQAVLVQSDGLPESAPTIRGWDFNNGCDLDSLLQSMLFTGFQASALGEAIIEVNRMIKWRLAQEEGGGAEAGTGPPAAATSASVPQGEARKEGRKEMPHPEPAMTGEGMPDSNSQRCLRAEQESGAVPSGAVPSGAGPSGAVPSGAAPSGGCSRSLCEVLLPQLPDAALQRDNPSGALAGPASPNGHLEANGVPEGDVPDIPEHSGRDAGLEGGIVDKLEHSGRDGGPEGASPDILGHFGRDVGPEDGIPDIFEHSRRDGGPDGLDRLEGEVGKPEVRCKIFLGYTSNLVSSGVREHIRYLVQHRMVDVVVTTAGGVEEDLIKCLGPTYAGDFHLQGAALRKRGLNRIGNLLVPNSNYCAFEDWVMPILDALLEEQTSCGTLWTPSKVIERLGKEIGNPDSVCYWAWRNGIPMFCPGLTDGSLGDMLFFHTYKNPGLVIDIVADIRRMNDQAMKAAPRKTGVIILGGGLPKHHICNANLMKNGADFAVYLNTAQEYDGSDSGARPDEAVSWGKIRADASPVKVVGDATILFPLLLSQTFYKAAATFPGPGPAPS